MEDIIIQNLWYTVGHKPILQDINLTLGGHSFVGLLGPNGSGKSTLLKHLYGVNEIQQGSIYVGQRTLQSIPLRERAQCIAVMTQFHRLDFDFSVMEITLMGRTPYKRGFDQDDPVDYEKARTALVQVGMWEQRERSFNSLSGGEQQRVMLARVLVQEPQYIILDEPTNHLDITYQLELLKIVKSLQVGVVAALHDLNLAAQFCDTLCLLKEGHIVATGTPTDVLTEQRIYDVYGVPAVVSAIEQGVHVRYRVGDW